jgi:hypothetical protein
MREHKTQGLSEAHFDYEYIICFGLETKNFLDKMKRLLALKGTPKVVSKICQLDG